MKTLIIGEVVDNKLSSGALEIITKANDLGLDFEIVTVGSEESPNIGSETFKNTYMKCPENKLTLGTVADKLKSIIEENSISLVLSPSTYVGKRLNSVSISWF